MLFPPGAAYKTENRQPASGGGQLSYREDFFVIPALAEITSSETLVSEKAP
jgi:hypothetical protein